MILQTVDNFVRAHINTEAELEKSPMNELPRIYLICTW